MGAEAGSAHATGCVGKSRVLLTYQTALSTSPFAAPVAAQLEHQVLTATSSDKPPGESGGAERESQPPLD
jgi:hypothetical protein